ncbi:MAG: hypothetical protein B9S32_02150 [Verrucomicrobia bacterium Tous-C9LFEB]|nr:MAG: hypothetical protein B9S32_02150 [Verrucomicrobia bacterium Tous-C9LFEB]
MEIKASGTLSFSDYSNFQRITTRKMERHCIALLCLFTVISILPHLLPNTTKVEINYIPYILWIFIAAIYVGIRYYTPKVGRRVFIQQKDLQLEQTILLNDFGFSSSTNIGKAAFDWSYFVKWKCENDLLILYRSEVLAHILPKRFFKDGDFDIFVAFLKTKFPQK